MPVYYREQNKGQGGFAADTCAISSEELTSLGWSDRCWREGWWCEIIQTRTYMALVVRSPGDDELTIDDGVRLTLAEISAREISRKYPLDCDAIQCNESSWDGEWRDCETWCEDWNGGSCSVIETIVGRGVMLLLKKCGAVLEKGWEKALSEAIDAERRLKRITMIGILVEFY